MHRFPLESQDCELLLAFHQSSSLADLSQKLLRDTSVISRQLQALAAKAPVLAKVENRWRLTALGLEVVRWTRQSISIQTRLIERQGLFSVGRQRIPEPDTSTALMILGMQKGFSDPYWGPRSNPALEDCASEILATFRQRELTIIHFRHDSNSSSSPLSPSLTGNQFKEAFDPREPEVVLSKTKNSAFSNPDLRIHLESKSIKSLVIIGMTTNLCVDSTARVAADLEYSVFIPADAVACFGKSYLDGRRLDPQTLQESSLATLDQEYATVILKEDLIQAWA